MKVTGINFIVIDLLIGKNIRVKVSVLNIALKLYMYVCDVTDFKVFLFYFLAHWLTEIS